MGRNNHPSGIRRPRGGIPLGWRRDPERQGWLIPDEDQRRAREIALEARQRDPGMPLALIVEILHDSGLRARGGRLWHRKQVARLIATDPDAYARNNVYFMDVTRLARIRRELKDHGGWVTLDELLTAVHRPSRRNNVAPFNVAELVDLLETLESRGKIECEWRGVDSRARHRRSW